MITAVLAIVGTLAGALLTGGLQHWSQRAQRAADVLAARRNDGLAAVTALVATLADHRRAMYVREETRLRGGDWTTARTESHATRAAITTPLLRVQLLLPASVATAAQTAAEATYRLRGADSEAALQTHRVDAIAAVDALVVTAASALNN